MRITLAQLNGFLQAKGVRDHCPACGREDWILQAEQVDEQEELVELTEVNLFGGLIGGPILGSFVFICGNCGFLRSHQMACLEEWLEAGGG